VDEVLTAAAYYLERTGRRVSIEYALIRDINDQPWRADLLAKRLRQHLGHLVHVNVIPLNPTSGSKWDDRRRLRPARRRRLTSLAGDPARRDRAKVVGGLLTAAGEAQGVVVDAAVAQVEQVVCVAHAQAPRGS